MMRGHTLGAKLPEEDRALKSLPKRLILELSAQRTLALRDAIAHLFLTDYLHGQGERPSLCAIATSTAASLWYSMRCSVTRRTARSRSSGEYGFEIFFLFCSTIGNSPRVLSFGKGEAVHIDVQGAQRCPSVSFGLNPE